MSPTDSGWPFPPPLYLDDLTDTRPQPFCEHEARINCSSDDIVQASLDPKLMQLISEKEKLIELVAFTRLHASKIYQDIEMKDEHLLAALENPNNGLFSLYTLYQACKEGQDSDPLDKKEKEGFARNIWKQCNAAFQASRKHNRDENQMHDGNVNWILKKYEITLSGPDESAPYTEMVAVIANHRGFFDMRIIEQEEGKLEDKIEDLEKELKESAKRRNGVTGYQEIYPSRSSLYTLANAQDSPRFHELDKFLNMVENLIESVDARLKKISPIILSRLIGNESYKKEYKPIKKIDLVRIVWDKCNSAFLAGKGAYDEETGYWLLDKHEIELPFMRGNELRTTLKVSAIVNPEGYFNFRLTLPGEETKQNLTEWLKNSECLRDRMRSTCSRQPEALQKLA